MGNYEFALDKYHPIRKVLKKRMDKERYWHTIGVAYTAACMAMRYGEDFERAYLAGLLHDCAKCYTDGEKLSMAETAGIPVSDVELRAPGLLHASLGAYLAKTEFGVNDEEILSAIHYHTVGKPEMTLLEKIIFVADYVEPNRPEFPMFKEIREKAFTDIDVAVYLTAKRGLEYLLQKGDHVLDPRSLETLSYYGKLTGLGE